jgi:peptide/nickel transport system substrate-binding protein
MHATGQAFERRRVVAVTLLVLGSLACTVPTLPVAAQTTGPPAEVVIAFSTDVQTFDPHMSVEIADVDMFGNVFDTLLRRNKATLKLEPALAVSWRNVNPTTWEFVLRQGVEFHDGEPFNAAAVKYSFDRLIDPKQKVFVAPQWSSLQEVQVVDPYRVRVVTKAPDPLLPACTASVGGYILPPKYFERVGAQVFANQPVGTGAWIVKERKKQERIVLDANPKWWGGAPRITRIVVRPIPEAATRVAALLAGEVDLVANMPPDQIDVISRSGKAKIVSAPQNTMSVLWINTRKGFLADKRMREAVSLAIDRQSLVRNLHRGYAKIANSPLPDSNAAYDPTWPPLPYDPDRARALLAEISYKGEPIDLDTPQGAFPLDREVTEAVAGMLQKVGINAKVNVLEPSVRAQKMKDKSFTGLYLAAPFDPYFDPESAVWRLIGPGGAHRYWENAEFDRLMTEARSTVDETRRRELHQKAIRIMMGETANIILNQSVFVFGHSNRVEFMPRGDERLVFVEITPVGGR